MKLAFVVRRIGGLQSTYTTSHLAFEAHRRGHDVWLVRARDLLVNSRGTVWGRAYRCRRNDPANPREFLAALRGRSVERTALTLDDLDAVFLRANPRYLDPSGDSQVGPTVLHIAELLRDRGVFVINDPTNLPRVGSKLYLMSLPHEVRPRTLVTSDRTAIKRFLRSLNGPAVLKPVIGFGGESVFYVRRNEVANVNQYIASLKKQGYIIAQEYLEGARRGDKRLLLLDGEPITVGGRVAVYRRTHPRDDMRNNMHVGGRRSRTDLTAEDRRTVSRISQRLREDGMYFVGLDLVDSRVLEVNVWNSGGIHNINELYGINVGEHVIARLEERLRGRSPVRAVS